MLDGLKKMKAIAMLQNAFLSIKIIDVSNMGESALRSHMKGKKHSMLTESCKNVPLTVDKLLCVSSDKQVQPIASTSNPLHIPLEKNATIKAEALWCLKVVKSHYSYRSCAGNDVLFRLMFSDSRIAGNFSCGEKKCSYICCFGLAPHFKSVLVQEVENENFVILFDESLNKFSQSKQMDIHVRLWEKGTVSTRYLSSVFLGHASADIMMEKFLECMACLPLCNIVQLSMDGPNVNWKFFDMLQSTLSADSNVQLLNTGSCGLHIVNNAFRHGASATGWEIQKLLSSLFRLFKDSPARREDFSKIILASKMPLKFCPHRWLENTPACERALEIWADIENYVNQVEKKCIKNPHTVSFDAIKTFTKDPFVLAKLHFFNSVSKQLVPFLKAYQSDKPMMPFMATDLEKMLRNMMNRFVKRTVMAEANSALKLLQVDLTDASQCCHYKEIDVGFQTEKVLKELSAKNISERKLMEFRMECRIFLQKLVVKLLEKNPLKYSLVRHMKCLDPRLMSKNSETCIKNLTSILTLLVDAHRIQPELCDGVIWQFKEFVTSVAAVKSSFINFDPEDKQQRVDTLLYEYMSSTKAFSELWKVVKLLLLLSHGQASVERGFSVNKELIVENMREESIVAQRIIYDHISYVGGIDKVNISKSLLLSVGAARQKYIHYLDDKSKEKEKAAICGKRKAILDEIDSIKKKRKLIEGEVKELLNSADDLALKAETTNNITYIVKSNSFRKTAHEKRAVLKKMDMELETKVSNLKSV